MKCSWVSPGAAEWADALRRCPHDFYHLDGYCSLSSEFDGGEAAAVLAEAEGHVLLLPVIARPIPGSPTRRDATSPYGYPGPIVSKGAPSDFRCQAMSAVFQRLRHDGFVSVFLRMHPLLNRGWGQVPEGLLLPHGETVVINLQDSPTQMWKQTRSGHRNEINRAKRDGQEFFWDTEWTHIEDVSRLYLETMKRVGASDYYLFPLDYFQRLRRSLGAHGALATVHINGEIAAGAVFTECDGLAQYHLSGSDARFRKQQPTKFLLHEMRHLGHEAGWKELHLGGGAGSSEDSLFRFKAGFSNSRARFKSWRCILDAEAYRQCCEDRGLGSENSLEGFFPLYRKPA